MAWAGAIVLTLLAGWTDWRSRRIPNRLTIPALVLGLLANSIVFGWSGAKSALLGAAVPLLLLLPLVLLRGLGAGDWKLMGALGAWIGPKQILLVLLITIFLTGVLAILQITMKKRWLTTLRNLGELIRGFFVYGLRPHPVIRLENPGLLSLPFGTVVAFAALLCFWGTRL